jgi:DNA-directed RNA polymerase II subunit RPB1
VEFLFDGDEMNTHMPQSIQTMSELMDFASVPYHIITPKDAGPVIEVVQDTMLGAFRITKDHVRIRDKTFANLQMVNSYFTGELPTPKDSDLNMFTGRQAYSMITPPGFYMKTSNKKKDLVVIQNGEYMDEFNGKPTGPTDKKVYTSMSHGMLPLIFHDYGPFEVRRFLDNLQRTICRWLMSSGFSVGISDLVIPDKTRMKALQDSIKKMKEEAYKVIKEVRDGDIKKLTMFSNSEYLEQEIMKILNQTNLLASQVSASDDRINRMMNMVNSGSKGKDTNITQMMACVGQQNVDGKRVAYGYTDRTLPHYVKFDDGPDARGFVSNSFISGLTPQEVFFHAMGGREGLIDKQLVNNRER